jgi:hypothetical protein
MFIFCNELNSKKYLLLHFNKTEIQGTDNAKIFALSCQLLASSGADGGHMTLAQ